MCSKKFPKEFVEKTLADTDSYPHYRRRDNEQYVVKEGISLDNRYVVPYNPYLTTKYKAHINVEICNSIKSCKYLYKYVYKGPDMASVSTEIANQRKSNEDSEHSNGGNIDEIDKFVNSRFLGASEGFWRICSFDVHGRDPSIQQLAVHKASTQIVMLTEENLEEAVSNPKDTTLLAWFKLNKHDTDS